jgi:hypothetical protein
MNCAEGFEGAEPGEVEITFASWRLGVRKKEIHAKARRRKEQPKLSAPGHECNDDA